MVVSPPRCAIRCSYQRCALPAKRGGRVVEAPLSRVSDSGVSLFLLQIPYKHRILVGASYERNSYEANILTRLIVETSEILPSRVLRVKD